MTNKTLVRRIGFAVVGVALLAPAWGQSTARLSGLVKDPSGAAVGEAVVSLYRPAMNEPAVTTKTTAIGLFEFDALPPEAYKVVIEKTGFAPYEVTSVQLSPGAETTLNGIQLALGQQPTVVNTSARLVGVQGSNAEVSTTVTIEQLEALPVLNRDPLSLIRTQAGVVANTATSSTVINGLRTSYSNVTLDSINVQDNTVRSNALDFLPTNPRLGQVEQFTLVTSNQSSTYGNGATQTAFVSPSGTNALRGSLFYLNSNNAFNAGSWFSNSAGLKRSYKNNLGGFTVGGPLIKEKLFGYAAYEFFRRRDTYGQRATVPHLGTVSAQDLLSLQSPSLSIDPAVAALLKAIPVANAANGAYEHAEANQADADNVTAKLDFVPSQRNTIVFSYLYTRLNTNLGSSSLFGNRYPVVQRSKASLFSGSWRYSPSGALTNELRFGANIAPIAFINQEQTAAYQLLLGPLQAFNWLSTFQTQGRRLKTYDLQDNASYICGRHNLQFGFQTQLIRIGIYIQDSLTVPTVILGTGKGDLGDALAVLSGQYYLEGQRFFPVDRSGTLGGGPHINYPSLDNYAGYLQDNWKLSRRLALTMGLRYDYYTPFSDSKGLEYQPALVNNNIQQTLNAPKINFNLKGDGFYKADKKNFAPNVGLAFDPFATGRTVFRAAYGISYVNDDFAETLRNASGQSAFYLGLQVVGTNGSLARFTALPVPSGGTTVTRPSSDPNLFFGVVDPALRTPYVQQWSAGIQHEMAGYLFNLRYIGNHATAMLRQDVVGFGSAVSLANSSGSRYNALQVEVLHRQRHNLNFQANYTFSKVLTDANTDTSLSLDPYRSGNNHRLDFGPAIFDIRHAFKANLIYDLPFWRSASSPAFLRSTLGGWGVSAIGLVQSGSPFSILTNATDENGFTTQTASTTLSGSALNHVISFNQTGNGPSIIRSGTDPSKIFFQSPDGTPGYLQPRSFYGPGSFDLDLALQKRFKITEHQSFELRGIVVNALNHPSFGFGNQLLFSSADSNQVSSNFGRQNRFSLYLQRTVQLSATYRF